MWLEQYFIRDREKKVCFLARKKIMRFQVEKNCVCCCFFFPKQMGRDSLEY